MSEYSPSGALPNQEERVMAGLAHLTALLQFTGVIGPIVIYVTQKDKSRFVAFHALQALAYQLLFTLAAFLLGMLYFLFFFGGFFVMPILMGVMPQMSRSQPDVVMPFFFLLPFILVGMIILLWLVYVVVAAAAGIMTFQGKQFRYPLLANLVEGWLAKGAGLPPAA